MSIKRSLAEYLLDRQDLPAPATDRFVYPQTIDGVTHETRNDARRTIQSKLNDRIYFDRRPQDARDHAAVVMQTIDHESEFGLAGEELSATELLTLTVYARGGDSPKRAENIGDLIQLAVSGWAGGYWGSTYVDECAVESQLSTAAQAPDASDQWIFERRLDLRVLYQQAGAPVFPSTPLTPVITYVDAAGVGTTLRLSAAGSLIPEGQTLGNVAWEVRLGGSGAPIVSSISGPPDQPAVGAGATGTNSQPEFDRTTLGLSGNVVHLTLALTVNAATVVGTTERVE